MRRRLGFVALVLGSVAVWAFDPKKNPTEPSSPRAEDAVIGDKPASELLAPKLIKRVEPVYPKSELKNRVEGTVVLRAIINIQGRAEDVEVTRSLGDAFDGNAIAALKQWHFQPGTRDGEPVPVRANFEINFRVGQP